MRRLFTKIFLWFGLAIVAVVASLILSLNTILNEPINPALREAAMDAATIYAQSGAEVFEQHGPAALADYLDRIGRQTRMRARFFTAHGEALTGSEAEPEERTLMEQTLAGGPARFELAGSHVRIAKKITTPGGKSYVIVAEMPRLTIFGSRGATRARLLRLFTFLVTAGLVCYGLTRYLTQPLIKLSDATKRFANGDLSTRVGSLIGTRRDEIADLGQDFDRMAERIESLVSAQKRLLGDISHELRSPLARLNIALELARQKPGPRAPQAPPIEDPLDRIEREAARLNDLIGQLLTLTRIETGAETGEKAEINLSLLIREIADDANFEAQANGCAVNVIEAGNCRIVANRELLRSAIENVVRNATRYTAEKTAVAVALSCDSDGQVIITVRDHGPGVPEAELAEIFRPFYRVADDRDRKTGGVGLGLSIAERAIGWHGGSVQASNAGDGNGLIVELRLPIK